MKKSIPKIDGASLILTEACNLSCKYCFENHKRDATKYMTEEVAHKTIDFLIEGAKQNNKNFISVTFFGGEPLMNLSVMKSTFDYAVQRTKEENFEFKCSLITNCTIYNDEYEEFLRHWRKNLGRLNVQLSVDGIPMVQNENRITANGTASSPMVEKTMKKYIEFSKMEGLDPEEIHIHGVVSKFSLPYMYESYMYYKSFGFNQIWFLIVQEEKWDDNDVIIHRQQLDLIANEVLNECKKLNNLKPFNHYSTFRKCPTQHPGIPCSAGRFYATVTTNGDLHPCHYFYFNDKSLKFGNVLTKEDDITKRQVFIDYGTENLIGDKPCADCDHFACYRCIAANHVANGNMLIGFEKYCQMSRVEMEVKNELKNKLIECGLMPKNNNKKNCNCGNDHNGKHECSNDNCKCNNDLEKVVKNIQNDLKVLNQKMNSLIEINSCLSELIIGLIQEKTKKKAKKYRKKGKHVDETK